MICKRAVLCCAVLCFAVLCCAVLCCAVLCCAVLCCAVLSCAEQCCAVLCCAVLCCAVLVFLQSHGVEHPLCRVLPWPALPCPAHDRNALAYSVLNSVLDLAIFQLGSDADHPSRHTGSSSAASSTCHAL